MNHAIEIQNVTKKYPYFTLDHLNLTLPKGCIMGLAGENGAGKSTTINILLGLVKEDEGSVSVFGSDPRTHADIREDIGVVLDSAVGMPNLLTVKQIGKMMKGIYKNWDAEVFERYLTQFSIQPNKKFSELSKGMKMKLEIAIALSHHAKLLILDEATSGLDPVIRDEILDIFVEFTRDEEHSVLISSHIISDLEKICDYIAVLQKGKLLLCEEKDALRERFAMIHCTKEELVMLEESAIIGKKETSYGVEAIVEKAAVPHGMETQTVTLEELFIYMMRRAK